MRNADTRRKVCGPFLWLSMAYLSLMGAWNLLWCIYSATTRTPLRLGWGSAQSAYLAAPPWVRARYSVSPLSGRWWWILSTGLLLLGFALMVLALYRREKSGSTQHTGALGDGERIAVSGQQQHALTDPKTGAEIESTRLAYWGGALADGICWALLAAGAGSILLVVETHDRFLDMLPVVSVVAFLFWAPYWLCDALGHRSRGRPPGHLVGPRVHKAIARWQHRRHKQHYP